MKMPEYYVSKEYALEVAKQLALEKNPKARSRVIEVSVDQDNPKHKNGTPRM